MQFLGLNANNYLAFIRWLEGEGEPDKEAGGEATCVILLDHPDCGNQPFYAKFYEDKVGQSKGLANEISSWLLAGYYGLPQPENACLVQMPLKRLSWGGLANRHGWLKKLSKKQAIYPAFCTRAINAPTPWLHYGRDAHDAMRSDLKGWNNLHKTIAFDDIVANIDRNLRNLLRRGRSDYVLIDHGRLVVPNGNWTPPDLNHDGLFANRLLDFTCIKPSNESNAIVAIAESASDMLKALPEIAPWLVHLTSAKDWDAFDKFLQARTINAAKRIAKRYALC